jgi:phage terminase Nu1 subunit (DNA packaging protein)
LAESVQRYLAYQRAYVTEQVKGTDEEYTSARARRMLAMAEHAELELQVKKGQLHHSDDVEFCFGMVLSSTRDKLLGVPAKVMHNLVGLTSPNARHEIVADAIRLALIDLRKAALAHLTAESEAYLMAERNGQAAADGAKPD